MQNHMKTNVYDQGPPRNYMKYKSTLARSDGWAVSERDANANGSDVCGKEALDGGRIYFLQVGRQGAC